MREDKEWKEPRVSIYVMAAKPFPWINCCDTSTCLDRIEKVSEYVSPMQNEWFKFEPEEERIHVYTNYCDSVSCTDRIMKFFKDPSLMPKKI